MNGGCNFGVDYYPEHWPEERWEQDAQFMKEAGINLVRLGEFSWSKLEPGSGVFAFEWLDRAIEMLGKYGMKVVIGTPSAAPPIWLVEREPSVLPVNARGDRLGFGGRHHCCHSSLVYRKYVRRIVRHMAEHVGGNPHVIGWQIDNELGNSHRDLCFCPSCASAFREWLQQKYISIDALNTSWGTCFWGQSYAAFEQIPVPLPTPNSHNPSLLLDWKRFGSDVIVSFLQEQLHILRECCPHHLVTHNVMGFFDKTDYYRLSAPLDVVAHDQYPSLFRGQDAVARPEQLAMTLDFIRGLKRRTFWIMEQQAGPAGWEWMGPTPRPNQLRLWTYQSVAHGADTVVYFRWRSCLYGTEQYWHGILPHHGEPGRRYGEIKQTIAELSPVMDELRGALPAAEVGIIYSYDQWWAHQIQPHHPELDYLAHVREYYSIVYEENAAVDFLAIDSADEVWSAYKVIIAPMLFLINETLLARITNFVQAGGCLITGMRSGVKSWNNTVQPDMLPGALSDVAGIRVEDYDCLRGVDQHIRWTAAGEPIDEQVSKWCDIITPVTAETLAVYTKDFYAGAPAVTRNRYGNGTVYYVGTVPGRNVLQALMRHALEDRNVTAAMTSPPGVEIARRNGAGGTYIFALNHNPSPETLAVPDRWHVLLGERHMVNGSVLLPPYETAVFLESM